MVQAMDLEAIEGVIDGGAVEGEMDRGSDHGLGISRRIDQGVVVA